MMRNLSVKHSDKHLDLISDSGRIKQVLTSCLESAIYETESHGVINIHLSTKPIDFADPFTKARISENMNSLDLDSIFVCQIDFKP